MKSKTTLIATSLLVLFAISLVFTFMTATPDWWRNRKGARHEQLVGRQVVLNTTPHQVVWEDSVGSLSSLVHANENLLLTVNKQCQVTARDIATGNILWQYLDLQTTIGYCLASFATTTNSVVLGTIHGLEVLDRGNGERVWHVIFPSKLANVPNIVVKNDDIIVAERSGGHTFIASYDGGEGTLQWDRSHAFPGTEFTALLDCPQVSRLNSDDTLCLTMHERLTIIDSEGQIYDHQIAPISLGPDVSYADGYLFTSANRSPRATVYAFDTKTQELIPLPTGCVSESRPRIVTSVSGLVLVSNGCNEVYTLKSDDISQEPEWVSVIDSTTSSFVSIDGNLGVVLTTSGEIRSIDMQNGNEVGRLVTDPPEVFAFQGAQNNLYSNGKYFYAVLDGSNIIVLDGGAQ